MSHNRFFLCGWLHAIDLQFWTIFALKVHTILVLIPRVNAGWRILYVLILGQNCTFPQVVSNTFQDKQYTQDFSKEQVFVSVHLELQSRT
jgi:hypothetical protein